LRYSQKGTSGTHAMILRSTQGAPPRMGTVRGYRRGTSLLWVRRSTAERPSPLRVCSDLSQNTLTGSVPSSLSALIKLSWLCVPPSCCACGRGGSDRSALLRVRAACLGHRAGAVQQGCCGVLSEGTSGTRCDYRVLKGHPLLWVRCAGTVRAHRCCGCGIAPPSGRVRFGCAATSTTTR
jgi:hypothetical protein